MARSFAVAAVSFMLLISLLHSFFNFCFILFCYVLFDVDRFASDLRLFAMEKVVEMGVHYQRSEIFKNVPWEPHTMI